MITEREKDKWALLRENNDYMGREIESDTAGLPRDESHAWGDRLQLLRYLEVCKIVMLRRSIHFCHKDVIWEHLLTGEMDVYVEVQRIHVCQTTRRCIRIPIDSRSPSCCTFTRDTESDEQTTKAIVDNGRGNFCILLCSF